MIEFKSGASRSLLSDVGDLKPENLLFTSTADDAVLKLTDFGFAKEGKDREREDVLADLDRRLCFMKETTNNYH